MKPLTFVLKPLQRVARAVFSQHLAMRRGQAGIELVLEDRVDGRQKGPSTDPLLAAQQLKEREALKLMRQQLALVLGEVPETRATLRHLVFVERALRKSGLRVLHKLPLDVLQRALEQLEALVINWSPEGLADLRSKMAVAIIDREQMDPDAEADAFRTSMPMDAIDLLDPPMAMPEITESDEDAQTLAAAYAAMSHTAPVDESAARVEFQMPLGAASPKPASHTAAPKRGTSAAAGAMPELSLRELER